MRHPGPMSPWIPSNALAISSVVRGYVREWTENHGVERLQAVTQYRHLAGVTRRGTGRGSASGAPLGCEFVSHAGVTRDRLSRLAGAGGFDSRAPTCCACGPVGTTHASEGSSSPPSTKRRCRIDR